MSRNASNTSSSILISKQIQTNVKYQLNPDSSALIQLANDDEDYTILFEMQSLRDISLTKFEFYSNTTDAQIEIWTKKDGLIGYDEELNAIASSDGSTNENGWHLLTQESVEATSDSILPYQLQTKHFIGKGHVNSLFLKLSFANTEQVTISSAKSLPYIGNDIELYYGHCNDNTPCIFNGIIHYDIDDDIVLDDTVKTQNISTTNDEGLLVEEYGNLFEVQSFHSLQITSLDIYINSTEILPVQVVYVQGSYYTQMKNDASYNPDWKVMFQGNVQSRGLDNYSSIDATFFNNIVINEDDEVITIMINLKTKKLVGSYTSEDKNDVVVLNDDLMVRKGYAVDMSYNPIAADLVFHGVVHYISDASLITDVPSFSPSIVYSDGPSSVLSAAPSLGISSIPTGVPTSIPTYITLAPTETIVPKEYSNIYYSFSILCPLSQQSSLLNIIDTSISTSLSNMLENDELSIPIQTLFQDYNISLHTVQSTQNHDVTIETNCIPTSDEVCFIINTNTTLSYIQNTTTTLSESILQYIFLNLASKLTDALPFNFQEYIGEVPLISNPVINLNTNVEDQRYLQELDEFAIEYYEDTVKDFLTNVAVSDTMEITDVSTSMDMSLLLELTPSRRLKSNKNGYELSTGILGKYNPPPEVQFDNLIQDSIDQHSDVLLSKLKEYPSFSKVQSITADFANATKNKTVPNITAKADEVPVIPEEPKGISGTAIIIIILSIVGLWMFIIAVVCAIKRTKKRNFYKDEHSNIMNLPIPASMNEQHDKVRRSSITSSNAGYDRRGSGNYRAGGDGFLGGVDAGEHDYYYNNHVQNYPQLRGQEQSVPLTQQRDRRMSYSTTHDNFQSVQPPPGRQQRRSSTAF